MSSNDLPSKSDRLEQALAVIQDRNGIGPGDLGLEVYQPDNPKQRMPQAYARLGWLLAKALIDKGLVIAHQHEGGTLFYDADSYYDR